MLSSPLSLVVLAVVVVLVIAKSVHVAQQDERFVVFRLGRYHDVLGPGTVLIAPFVDLATRVKLSSHMPEWQSYSPHELKTKIRDLVLNDSNPERFAT